MYYFCLSSCDALDYWNHLDSYMYFPTCRFKSDYESAKKSARRLLVTSVFVKHPTYKELI